MSRQFPTKEQLLYNHTSEATAYVVEDYPYGFRLRCKIRYWVESTKHGDRFCSQTTNPKHTGEYWNKPKKSTYYKFIYMHLNEEKHVSWNAISYSGETRDSGNQEFKELLNFVINVYGLENFSKVAQVTLRMSYYMHIQVVYMHDKCKYLTQTLPAYETWYKETLKHVGTCEFSEIANHPEAPVMDGDKDASIYRIRESAPISLMDM